MDGPVKERLTGALIFVAALVIIVPEMLFGPGGSSTPEAATSALPAGAEVPLRTHIVQLDDASSPPAARQAEPAPELPVAEPPIAVPAPAAAAPQPEPAPEPAPVRAVDAKPGRAWWAQLGSFSSRANADKLSRQLRAAGYAVDVSKINAAGKELYRVRAGPVQSRADAQALQARLASAGHKSTLVAP